MTTITSDRKTRVNAIPFRGMWMSNLNYGGVGNTLVDGQADGDLRPFSLGLPTQMRILTPTKGDLIEARLTINAVSPPTGFMEMRIYIGEFESDGITPKTLTSDEIARQWKILTGFDSPAFWGTQDNVFFDGLNIMPLIPKRGDAKFNEDAFILGLELFCRDSGFVLFDFHVDCTSQIAEVLK